MSLRIRHYSSCCLVLVAMAALFFSSANSHGHGHGHGYRRAGIRNRIMGGLNICQKADYPALCRAVVKGLGSPSIAIDNAIHQLIFETKRAMGATKRGKSSSAMGVCRENYDDAISNLQTCLTNLKRHDKAGLNINLSAALTDYVTCDDAYAEGGQISPFTRTNTILRHMASNCLYLSSLIRF